MRKNNDSAFTILVIGIAIAGLALIAGSFLVSGCARTDLPEANRAAHEYIKSIPHATGVVCAETDTDGDGYVSCTVFRDGELDPLPIECGGEKWCVSNCAKGCKYNPIGKVR